MSRPRYSNPRLPSPRPSPKRTATASKCWSPPISTFGACMSFAQLQPPDKPALRVARADEPRLPPAVHETSALDLTLRALRPILSDHAVTELCINRPGEAFVETREGWRCVPLEFADFQWCVGLAKLVANSTRQRIDGDCPLLSASLPSGERIQIVLPPATTTGTVAIT